MLYSQKGYKNSDSEFAIGSYKVKRSGSVNYNYLELPILAKINADGLFFEAGPQFGYLLNIKDKTKQESNIPGIPSYDVSSAQNLDNVNRFELGYAVGLGYQADSGPMIGLRYNGAFTDFAKDAYQNGSYKNARNSAFQLYVGYLLGSK
ncbi:outer membrane beta-barrel protein [Hymenobacter jeollabukensis]|uniref:outer membrane beta-barrel protein n=1 Tax=Hymenobacter jeollabukensis TaxID=2025313 RepID=UPI0014854D82|nr:outer membrane beta-barrel protein [Hymenobacter jeollabukensis]